MRRISSWHQRPLPRQIPSRSLEDRKGCRVVVEKRVSSARIFLDVIVDSESVQDPFELFRRTAL
jgi:hypothetical protein